MNINTQPLYQRVPVYFKRKKYQGVYEINEEAIIFRVKLKQDL